MLRNKGIKKIRIKELNTTFYVRKINEFDLLGVEGHIPIFQIEQTKEESELQDIINSHNAEIEQDDKKEDEFKKHIVYRCIVKVDSGEKQSFIDRVLEEDLYLEIMFWTILYHSTNIKVTQKINRQQAENIYFLYQNQDYAEKYFTDNKLNWLEKISFNTCIHNAGRKKENQLTREATRRMRSKHGR